MEGEQLQVQGQVSANNQGRCGRRAAGSGQAWKSSIRQGKAYYVAKQGKPKVAVRPGSEPAILGSCLLIRVGLVSFDNGNAELEDLL